MTAGVILRFIPGVLAGACPVCFGKALEQTGFTRGLTIGVLLLIAITFSILAAFVAAIVRVERDKMARDAAAKTA